MNSKLRQELEAMKNLQTGDSFTAEHVHTLVDGILEGVGEFKYVNYDSTSFPYPQTIGSTADSIVGLGNADESMIDTIFIMPNKETDSTATMMIVVDEVTPSTDPKTYQYVYVGNINSLPSDVLTESSIVNDLTSGGTDRPLSAEQGRTLNSHVNYTTCGSGAGDQVKLISDDGFELSTHLRLLVKMNNTNTNSTPKFNINNTGAKDVWYNGSVASDTNTWSAGEVLDIYYDGTNYISTTYGGAQFSTGEKVGNVGIDDEPTAGSDNLVKSSGIQNRLTPLQLKTNTIRYSDQDVTSQCTITYGYGVNGTTGELGQTYEDISYAEIEVGNAKYIRFLGACWKSAGGTSGYAFGCYGGTTWYTKEAHTMDVDSSLNVSIKKEYIVKVPEGATHFRVNSSYHNGNPYTVDDFYCHFITLDNTASKEIVDKIIPINETNAKDTWIITPNSGVSGITGQVVSAQENVMEVGLNGANRVRFLNALGKTQFNSGYAFGYYEDNTWHTIWSKRVDMDASIPESTTKEYIVDVPEGATHFHCNASNDTLFNLTNFYCYLQVFSYPAASKEEINKLNEEVIELNETFDKLTPITNEVNIINFCTVQYGKGVQASTGNIVNAGNNYAAAEVEIIGANKIRFSGLLTPTQFGSGYAFGYYEDTTWHTVKSYYYDIDSSIQSTIQKEYIVNVPTGATHFRFNISNAGAPNYANDSYCYKQVEGGFTSAYNNEDNKNLSDKIYILDRKLSDIPYEEQNVTNLCTITHERSVSGTTGEILSNVFRDMDVAEVEVGDADYIRFLGAVGSSGSYGSGFAFGYYTGSTWHTVEAHKFEIDPSLGYNRGGKKDYLVKIPQGVTHFRTVSQHHNKDPYGTSNFYCYLQNIVPVGKRIDSGSSILETDVTSQCTIKYQYGVNGTTGKINSVSSYDVSAAEVAVGNAKYVRFLGACFINQGSSGYAFGYYENETWHTVKAYTMDNDTSLTVGIQKEYLIEVPVGATHFRVNSSYQDNKPYGVSQFYCYLQELVQPSSSKSYVDNITRVLSPLMLQERQVLQNLRDAKRSLNNFKNSSFVLIHFSDIHSDNVSLKYIVDFKNRYSEYIDDAIHTGDNVQQRFAQGMEFWSYAGADDILNVIGNHDTAENNYGSDTNKTAADCYGQYLAPFISNWGNVQYTENLCYYYKDYPSYNIRLIVLDLYRSDTYDGSTLLKDNLDTVQRQWFIDTLADARTNNLHVIVAAHAPEKTFSAHIDTPFDCLEREDGLTQANYAACLGQDAIGAISDFISAGGKFVCYLCGHMHTDSFRKIRNHDNMLSISIQNSSLLSHLPYSIQRQNLGPNGPTDRIIGEKSEFLFNILIVDTEHSILNLLRVGQDSDNQGRHLGSLTYSYSSNKIISQW